jgi:hypothetical protein
MFCVVLMRAYRGQLRKGIQNASFITNMDKIVWGIHKNFAYTLFPPTGKA